MKKQRWHAKAVGNDAEKLIDDLAHAAGLQWDSETVVDGARRRIKGAVDRIYHLRDGRKLFAEIKYSGDGRYTYRLNSEEHDIKWSQIARLMREYLSGNEAGLIFVTRSEAPVFVHIRDFINWYTETKSAHIKFNEARILGLGMADMEWIHEYRTERSTN